jgi:sRNA-binding carbon storage regulator CsrA
LRGAAAVAPQLLTLTAEGMMLVVKRRSGQKLVIEANGKTIVIWIDECKRGSCRVGIEADRDVLVRREELEPLKEA